MVEQKKIIANYEKQDEAMARRAKVRLSNKNGDYYIIYQVRCWYISGCINLCCSTLCCNGITGTSLLVIPYSIS